jgi:uncharacterized membrane protein
VRRCAGAAAGIAMAVVFTGPASATLQVCNRTAFPTIFVALGYEDPTQGGTASGWWQVQRGQCTTLVEGDLEDQYYYIYAQSGSESTDRTWESGESGPGADYCISNNAFTLRTKEYEKDGNIDCEAAGHATKGFIEVDTGDDADFTYNFQD